MGKPLTRQKFAGQSQFSGVSVQHVN